MSALQEEEYFLTLPSNVSGSNNTISSWTTTLPHTLQLHGQWEVGLAEIIYTNSSYTIPDPLPFEIRYLSGKIAQFFVPEGNYENAEALIDMLHFVIGEERSGKRRKRDAPAAAQPQNLSITEKEKKEKKDEEAKRKKKAEESKKKAKQAAAKEKAEKEKAKQEKVENEQIAEVPAALANAPPASVDNQVAPEIEVFDENDLEPEGTVFSPSIEYAQAQVEIDKPAAVPFTDFHTIPPLAPLRPPIMGRVSPSGIIRSISGSEEDFEKEGAIFEGSDVYEHLSVPVETPVFSQFSIPKLNPTPLPILAPHSAYGYIRGLPQGKVDDVDEMAVEPEGTIFEDLGVRFNLTASNRVQVVLASSRVASVHFSKGLMFLLGLSSQTVKESVQSKYAPTTRAGSNALYIFSDIAAYSILGDTTSNQLRIVPVSGAYGETCNAIFNPIRYYRCRTGVVDSIQIDIRDEYGELIKFHYGTSVAILHVRKKPSQN